ncbi:MAG: APC family permease [Trueperaceae bacterium]|nr:APC family permease [Trueperaceae bacterium]
MASNASPQLERELGVFGAVMLGLGSIVGTGVFVSIGIAAGVAGPSVVLAVVIGALVATCNGLSSAQLAAAHPVSGGTYEYGYKFLNPLLGFSAGWLFMLAKSASAATAALGFAGYLLGVFGVSPDVWLVVVALAAVVGLTLLVLSGLRRSNLTNIVIVSVTLLTLAVFVVTGLPTAWNNGTQNFVPFVPDEAGGGLRSLLYAAALMFVAYTGYGRIATLGEEVKDPARAIPKAIIITLVATLVLYVSVAAVGVGAVGAETLANAAAQQAAPLELAARQFGPAWVPPVLALGAMTAMLGVLLNLVLGLSRVLLAMGRRRDMPASVATLNEAQTTPTVAVTVVGVVIGLLVLIGDVRLTWSFSAFTVLCYYALTNLAALRLPPDARRFPRWISWLGLIACVSLAVFVEFSVLLVGVGVIVLGIIWHVIAQRLSSSDAEEVDK